MNLDDLRAESPPQRWRPSLGVFGHLALFAWFLSMVMLAPRDKTLETALICLLVAAVVYPRSLRRVLRWRWLLWMLLMALPPVFFVGELDASFAGIPFSTEGLLAGLQIAVRFVVVLIAIQGFTSSVDIPTLAGLLERFGLQGLGFSLGVALNMLPGLQEASLRTWHTLRMRGGLRKKRWRALQLLAMTVIANALRRAEDISLAAEARAFSPEKARPLPIQRGNLDWLPLAIGLPVMLLIFWL
ncbi:MAG: energy-coupling factor transporter transmembrane component T [Anaerolineales bacterium]|jgi:energy-coupling factor transporter transmembrane protein EcfT